MHAVIGKSLLYKSTVEKLIKQTTSILSKESVVIDLQGPHTIVGDIHGNIEVLLDIFTLFGYPPNTKYVFLGDYVDRGRNSVSVICTLFALKCLFSDSIYLIRGNHECRCLSEIYGFKQEAMAKYDESIYELTLLAFDEMPLMARVDRVMLSHGGFPSSFISMDELAKKPKPKNLCENKDVVDILWNDPCVFDGMFESNSRGIGQNYSPEALKRYLSENRCNIHIRSHQLCPKGYLYSFENKAGMKDICLTIFSCRDYGSYDNDASIAKIDGSKVETHVLKHDNPRPKTIIPDYILCDIPKPTCCSSTHCSCCSSWFSCLCK